MSPSNTLLITRFGQKAGFSGYSIRAVTPTIAAGGAVSVETKEIATVCLSGGKPQLSFDERFMTTHQYVDTTAVVLTPGMGDAVQMDKAGILEIADIFVCNKADHPGEHELVRDLRDIAGKRPILETVATEGQGIAELLAKIVG